MANSRYAIEPLGHQHDRAAFSCGVEELDRYFRQQASQDVRRRATVVWVLFDPQESGVAGYYTLSASTIEPTALSPAIANRLPRYPALPALLIGRLAVALGHRGLGLGEVLLFDALHRSLELSQQLGAIAVVVEAKDEAACSFYEHYDFLQYEDESHRLYLPMQTIAQMFADQS